MLRVDREANETIVCCDECGKQLVVKQTQFGKVVKELKNHNWVIFNVGNEWCQYCCNVHKNLKTNTWKKLNENPKY